MTFSKSILTTTLTATLLWMGCQKNNSVTTTPTVIDTSYDYAPLTEGNSFIYQFATKNLTTGEWKVTEMRTDVTSKETFQKQQWNVVSHSMNQNLRAEILNELSHCDGYVLKKLLKTYNAQGVSIKNYEIPMLQYPIAKGKTWKSQDFVTQVNSDRALVYTMFAVRNTGLMRKVNGMLFTDVIHVDEEAAVEINGIAETIPVSRYYDKKVGLIEAITFGEHPVTHEQDTMSIQRLVGYKIN
jgi:hypothetical protein